MASVYFDAASRLHKGNDHPSVDGLTLDIQDGEFLVLVGPSGCGKSTTLRMLAGLEPVDRGRILINGHDQAGVRPRDRDIAMVFQSYALYPNMSAADNMGFALRNSGVSKEQTASRVMEAAKILELQDMLNRRPGQMSGGQRQRVAMGRAIVRDPKVFCMDEPLSNLDAKLRVSTRAQIAALQRRLEVTTVYVTHDQVEAMTMGHRVAVLRDGVLQQVATPDELYRHPVNTFVAGFIGSPAINLVRCDVRDGAADLYGASVPLERGAVGDAGSVQVGVRPESWTVVSGDEPGALRLTVDIVESLGSESFVHGHPDHPTGTAVLAVDPVDGSDQTPGADGAERTGLTVRLGREHRPAVGDVLHVVPLAQEVLLFDNTSGERLSAQGTQGAFRADFLKK
ncbi:ABC transporter ATP-binding protein [Allobranchiibius sp. GilTou73]|uniref:ABC transporter ATP-binding protein n=1 Tax=Allobranchiibius sp. GilTou73 TaxID=2904523 RepID=UPI001F36867B|nr:ATP-binding cassette domain-containing protein [Allobranchiibius sp. GilTou73]UIJ33840.1 ATP-binding cassette domain-containing protein [Allobranchiibius sp. GilTou73]